MKSTSLLLLICFNGIVSSLWFGSVEYQARLNQTDDILQECLTNGIPQLVAQHGLRMTNFQTEALYKTFNVTHLQNLNYKNDTTVMKYITRLPFNASAPNVFEIKFKSWDYLLMQNFPNNTATQGWKASTKIEQDVHGNLTRFAYSFKFQKRGGLAPNTVGDLLSIYPSLNPWLGDKGQLIWPSSWNYVNESHEMFLFCDGEQTAAQILLTIVKDNQSAPFISRAELAFRFFNPWSVCCQQNFYDFYWSLLNYLPCIAEVTVAPIDHPIFANCYPNQQNVQPYGPQGMKAASPGSASLKNKTRNNYFNLN